MKKKMTASLFTLLPQKAVSSLVGKWAKSRVSKGVVPLYARMYRINVDEMQYPLKSYPHLTGFFTRRLQHGARQVNEGESVVVSPVDGTVSSFGQIKDGMLIQAKGIDYSLAQLLGSEGKAKTFRDGQYLTIYLSPRDYHRIHIPFEGAVCESTYIPGRLFPVNKVGVEGVKGLFTKNERLISYVETSEGRYALVKVGAFIVGSVVVNYPQVCTKKKGVRAEDACFEAPIHYEKGEELGYFEFGSTVILLFEKDAFELDAALSVGETLQMGEIIGVKK